MHFVLEEEVRLILIGFGVVGQGFAEILRDKADELAQRYSFKATIVGVATRSRGALYHPAGLKIDTLLKAIAQGHLNHYPNTTGLKRNVDIAAMLEQADADAVLECAYSNFDDAQPALEYCRTALRSGKHLVLANKGPIALAYHELQTLAREQGRQLRFEATVMAGTPALQLAREGIAGSHINAARGILNGTTNYILTQMERGMAYEEALAQAQALGYAEADPTADVGGWDAAGKVLILGAALFNQQWKMADLQVEGIEHITRKDIEVAHEKGERWKLLAEATPEGGKVRPVRIPQYDPLATVQGATNAITYTSDLLGHVTLVGPGAGRKETGAALLDDLLAIQRYGE